jgi:hypothetical protein
VKAIAEHPTPEMYQSGLEIDRQCARCGSSMDDGSCEYCEDGFDGHDCGEDCCCCLYPEENVPCQYCDGTGVWRRCLSSPEWCKSNPLPGRDGIERGQIEWFTFEDRGPTP